MGDREASRGDVLRFSESGVASRPQREGARRIGLSQVHFAMIAIAMAAVLAAAAFVARVLTPAPTSTSAPAIRSTAARPVVLGAWGNVRAVLLPSATRPSSWHRAGTGPVTFSATGQ